VSKLLVEGVNDQHVIWSLLQRRQFPEVFVVEQKGGYSNLLRVLSVELKGSELDRLGIVLDADLDVGARWSSVKDVLRKNGFPDFPTQPSPDGTVVSNGRIRIGVWLMPDNVISGMLEDFVQQLLPEGDPIWPISSRFVEELPETENRYRNCHIAKARIHAWLAVQDEPGSPMGQAITRRMLEDASAECNKFMVWLERLFVKD
jgi:hypothetical protein